MKRFSEALRRSVKSEKEDKGKAPVARESPVATVSRKQPIRPLDDFDLDDYDAHDYGARKYATRNYGTSSYANSNSATRNYGTSNYANSNSATRNYGTSNYANSNSATSNYAASNYATSSYATRNYVTQSTQTDPEAHCVSKPRRPDDQTSKPRKPDATSKPRKPDEISKPRKPDGIVYGIVLYDFVALWRDELAAKAGEAIIVVAQSNPEWFVAKPIGRLGGPGLIPVSFVEIRDIASDKPVENLPDAIKKAGVPSVEEWKKMGAEYEGSIIPLGKLEGNGSRG